MAKNLAELLESLSGYKHLFKAGGPQAHLNPVNHSYLRLRIGGVEYFVLSRIADCGLDFTQRSNKIAHHVVLDASELTSVGPAAISGQADFFLQRWEGEPRTMPFGRKPIPSEVIPSRCAAWEAAMGDPGWGGVLAQHAIEHPADPAFVIFPAGTDILPLFAESQQLLPPAARWSCSFSTYFATTPPGVDCRWRGVVDATPEAERLRRTRDRLVIDLVRRGPVPESSSYVEAARTGNHSRITAPSQQIPVEEKPTSSQAPTLRSPVAAETNPVEAPNLPHSVPVGWEAGSAPPALPPRTPPQGEPRHVEDELWEPRRRAKGPLPLPLLIVAGSILLILGVAVGAVMVSFPYGPAADAARTSDPVAAGSKGEVSLSKPQMEYDDSDREKEDRNLAAKDRVDQAKSPSDLKVPTQTTTPPRPRPPQPAPITPPPGLFEGFATEIGLPLISAGFKDEEYLSPQNIGVYADGDWSIKPALLQTPFRQLELKIQPVPKKKRWLVTAPPDFRPIAKLELASGQASIAWVAEGLRKPSLQEQIALRATFLVLRSDPGDQRIAISLRQPIVQSQALRFSHDLAPLIFVPGLASNGPPVEIPDQQQLVYTGVISDQSTSNEPIAFRIASGESWEVPLDADKSLLLRVESAASQLGMHIPKIGLTLQLVLPNEKRRLDHEYINDQIETRRKSLRKAIDRTVQYHVKRAFPGTSDRRDKQKFEIALQGLKSLYGEVAPRAPGGASYLMAEEAFESWLREGDWRIPDPIDPKRAPPLYINDKSAPTQKQLSKEQRDLPLPRLQAWKAIADAIPSMQIHIRATRQLPPTYARDFEIPPYADVFVVGSPPPFDPDPRKRN